MSRERGLQIVLWVVGLLFCAGAIPVLTSLFTRGHVPDGDDMMLSLYATLGVFLLLAARNPPAHRGVIGFAAWSSFAHATVMAVLAYRSPDDRAGGLSAVAVLCIIGVALLVLSPRRPLPTPIANA